MIYVGIDNGLDGGIVGIDHKLQVVGAHVMPTLQVGSKKSKKARILDIHACWDILRDFAAHDDVYVVLEKAQSMPKQGVSGVFKYGEGFGAMQAILIGLNVPHEITHPTHWQKAVLKGVIGTDTKTRAILKCRRALPQLDLTPGRKRKPHTGLADGGCMALHAFTVRNPFR